MTPDQAIWVGQGDAFIGRLDSSMRYTQFAVHTRVGRLSPAPDNAVWTLELDNSGDSRVARISATGQETDYALPKGELPVVGSRAVWGPDGAIWLTNGSGIGRLTADGSYYRLRLQGNAADLGFAPVGNLWVVTIFRGYAAALQEWSMSGQPLGSQPLNVGSQMISVGADGTVWFQGIAQDGCCATSSVIGILASGRLELFAAYDAIELDQVLVGGSLWYSGLYGLGVFTPPT
jgi:streptogramin lyase